MAVMVNGNELSLPLAWDISTVMSALHRPFTAETSEGEDYALMKFTRYQCNGTDKSYHIWKLDTEF